MLKEPFQLKSRLIRSENSTSFHTMIGSQVFWTESMKSRLFRPKKSAFFDLKSRLFSWKVGCSAENSDVQLKKAATQLKSQLFSWKVGFSAFILSLRIWPLVYWIETQTSLLASRSRYIHTAKKDNLKLDDKYSSSFLYTSCNRVQSSKYTLLAQYTSYIYSKKRPSVLLQNNRLSSQKRGKFW
jgi:hypothetical protein